MFGQNDNPYERAKSGMTCLYALLAVNVMIFLFLGRGNGLELIPAKFMNGDFLTLFTAIFYHQEFFHLFFNMFSLYIFGTLVAPRTGAVQFLLLYLISGLAGNLLWLASNWGIINTGLLGASGAVMGIIIASAMFAPNIDMYFLFIPFPIKLRTMAIVFIAIDVFNEFISGGTAHVAYLAHIGGFIAGYLYTAIFLRKYVLWNPLAKLFGGLSESAGNYSMPHGWHMSSGSKTANAGSPPNGRGPVTQRELDYLLDKISKQGINSLTPDEMDRLRQAREQMRGERH